MSLPNQGGSPGIKLYSSMSLKEWKFENWLVSYDRAVWKVNPDILRKAVRGE